MSKDPYGTREPSIPVAYGRLLLDIVGERGVDGSRVLARARLSPDILAKPDARLTPVEWTRLSLGAIELTGDPGLGFEYGLRLRVTAHGFLGYATMASSTVREAVELVIRFSRMRLPMYAVDFTAEGGEAVLGVSELHPLPVLREYFYECFLVGVVADLGTLVDGFQPGECTICFAWPEPAYYARYRDRLTDVRFGGAANQIRMPSRLLDRRLPLADPIMRAQAIAQCERELASVKLDVDDVAARVRSALTSSADGRYPDLAEVAAKLFVSDRTLKRKLQLQGTSFQKLLDGARLRDARTLLEHSALDVKAISERLGYTVPTNFTRAFRAWTGTTPGRYRAAIRAESKGRAESSGEVPDGADAPE